jgi:hypothetical protein
LRLVQFLPRDVDRIPEPSFNIIGSCADLFRFAADAREILRLMKGAFGMEPLCVLTSDTSVADIENMGAAHINLVIRREGEPAARQLQERFGTPYLMGRPYGVRGTAHWIDGVAEALADPADRACHGMANRDSADPADRGPTSLADPAGCGLLSLAGRDFVDRQLNEANRLLSDIGPRLRHLIQEHPEEARLSIGAHADVAQGILDFGCGELSLPRGSCWCDDPDMASSNIPYFTEEQWTEAVQAPSKGLLMASGEALEWAGRNRTLQIANPDTQWRLNPYVPPFVGFRGALHLIELWLNALLEQE